MNRRHLVIPAALIAASALFGGRALVNATSNGSSEADPAASTMMASGTGEAEIAARAAQLDAAEQRIEALASDRPPALEPVSSSPAISATYQDGQVSISASPGQSSQGSTGERAGDDDDSHESAEHDADDDHGGADDDHGGGDDHGGFSDHGDDDDD
jgi:hypothetical protein